MFVFFLFTQSLGTQCSLLSPFARLSGKTDVGVGKEEIQVVDSNLRPELLVDAIPKVDLDEPLNSYMLDFYNHGGVVITNNAKFLPRCFQVLGERQRCRGR